MVSLHPSRSTRAWPGAKLDPDRVRLPGTVQTSRQLQRLLGALPACSLQATAATNRSAHPFT